MHADSTPDQWTGEGLATASGLVLLKRIRAEAASSQPADVLRDARRPSPVRCVTRALTRVGAKIIERESTRVGRRIDMLLIRVEVTVGREPAQRPSAAMAQTRLPPRGRGRGSLCAPCIEPYRSGGRAVVHKRASKSRAKSAEFPPRFHRVPQPDDAAVDTASDPASLRFRPPKSDGGHGQDERNLAPCGLAGS